MGAASAQTPAPFPRPSDPDRDGAAGAPDRQAVRTAEPRADPPRRHSLPRRRTSRCSACPIYPGAEFITSYDAGRGQRYYLFGIERAVRRIVAYYRTVLKQKGELVYDEPPTHEFDVGRYSEETMAFPPGVTMKDYTWGELAGLSRTRSAAASPRAFPTIIQIVPVRCRRER